MTITQQKYLIPYLLFAFIFLLNLVGCRSSSSKAPLDVVVSLTVEQKLQQLLDTSIVEGFPAAAISVRSEAIHFDGVSGVEDLASQIPLTVNHRFYLASIGKTYTALVILKLVEQGLLELDDPISTWLGADITDQIPSSHLITIRHLLNHTSGIFDFQNDGNKGEQWYAAFAAQDPNYQWSNFEVLDFFLGKALHFEPGTSYRYSNSNYVLAAIIAENASGQRIDELVRYFVIEPLHLTNTLHGDEFRDESNMVHGYSDYADSLFDFYPYFNHYGLGDGGVQASVADVAEFVRHVFTDRNFLSDSLLEEFTRPSGVGESTLAIAMSLVVGDLPPDGKFYVNGGEDQGTKLDFNHFERNGKALTLVIAVSASFGEYEQKYETLYDAVIKLLSTENLIP